MPLFTPGDRRRVLALCGLIALALAVIITIVAFLVGGLAGAANTAQLVSIPLAAAPLAVALIKWSRQDSGATSDHASPPKRRPTVLWAVAGAVALLAASVWIIGFPDGRSQSSSGISSTPTSSAQPGTTSAPATADVIFRDNFENLDRGWYVGQAPNGVVEYVSGQYRISANRGGVAVWSPAPAARPAAAVKIIANARITNGQGGWGVWCRGTSTGERYEFIVTHAGVAEIKTPGGKGTGLVSIPGFDAYQDAHVVAECRDAPYGAGVELTLAVNGKTIPPYLDRGPLLGPGKVGIHAFSFGDVHGDPADVRFSYFEVDGLR